MPVIGSEIYKFKSLPSTNDFMKKRVKDYSEGTVIVADHQSRGKGRGSKRWISREGKGLYFSVLLKPTISPKYIGMLSLAASLATANAVSTLTAAGVKVKWPNDVIMNNKKIAGILLESHCLARHIEYIILGIGLNINQNRESWPEDLSVTAGSVFSESGLLLNRVKTLDTILNSLDLVYTIINSQFNWQTTIKKNWEMLCVHLNKNVRIINKDEIIGKFTGVSEFGEAVVETAKNRHNISIGEFSLREV